MSTRVMRIQPTHAGHDSAFGIYPEIQVKDTARQQVRVATQGATPHANAPDTTRHDTLRVEFTHVPSRYRWMSEPGRITIPPLSTPRGEHYALFSPLPPSKIMPFVEGTHRVPQEAQYPLTSSIGWQHRWDTHYHVGEQWPSYRITLLGMVLFVAVVVRLLPELLWAKGSVQRPAHHHVKEGKSASPYASFFSWHDPLGVMLWSVLLFDSFRLFRPDLLGAGLHLLGSQGEVGYLRCVGILFVGAWVWRVWQYMGIFFLCWLGKGQHSSSVLWFLRQVGLRTSVWFLLVGVLAYFFIPLGGAIFWFLGVGLGVYILLEGLGVFLVSRHHFRQHGAFLHFILYLCTTELLPFGLLIACWFGRLGG